MPDEPNAALAALPASERLAKAVLLFLRGGPWLPEDQAIWCALTGSPLATTRTLGDLARQVEARHE
jgi:hypothetical protein